MRELEAIGAKSIGFDDLCAGFDIGLVHAEYGFRLGGVEFIEAALRADGFVQHGAHSAIGDEDGVFDAFVEVLNLHLECRPMRSENFGALTRDSAGLTLAIMEVHFTPEQE